MPKKLPNAIKNKAEKIARQHLSLRNTTSINEITRQINSKLKKPISAQSIRTILIKRKLLSKKLVPMKKEKFFVLLKKNISLKTKNKLWEYYSKKPQNNARNRINAVTLIIAANKIFNERNKSLRQISIEMTKNKIKISSTALLYINKLLEIRTKKELKEMIKKGSKKKGGKIKKLSPKEKQQIQKLKNKGKTPSEIAKTINRSYGTILKYYLK